MATAALAASALLLVAVLFRKIQGDWHGRAIAVLFSFCIAVSVGAAALGVYTLGGTRQNIYLGPIVFLTVGFAFHWTAGWLSSLTRRVWLAPGLAISAASVIALAGVGDMRQDSPYRIYDNVESVLPVLKERAREEDMVYADWRTVPGIRFYLGKEERPANYHYGTSWCLPSTELCLREMANLAASLPNVPNRIFLVHVGKSIEMGGLGLLGEQVSVERVTADGYFNVSVIANAKEVVEPAYKALVSDYESVVSGEPAIRSDFDVYLRENTLTYVKEACAPDDTEARFFLHLYPVDVNDLPDHRKQHGFDNLDFRFDRLSVRFDGICMATVDLPEYDIVRISTGQFVSRQGRVWEGEIRLAE